MQQIDLTKHQEDIILLNKVLKKAPFLFPAFKKIKCQDKNLVWQPLGIIQKAFISSLFGLVAGNTYTCQERRYGFVLSPDYAHKWHSLTSKERVITICHEFYHQFYQIMRIGNLYWIYYYSWFVIRPWTWVKINYHYRFSHPYEAVKHNGAFLINQILSEYL